MDRGKVIKGLENCTDKDHFCKKTCPYYSIAFCRETLMEDELELLKSDSFLIENQARIINDLGEKIKEQEPTELELEGGGSSWWYVCGECHGMIDDRDAYCRHCGRRIKRNE